MDKNSQLSAKHSMLSLTSPTKLHVIPNDNKVVKRKAKTTLGNITNSINRPKLINKGGIPPLLRRNSSFFREESPVHESLSGALYSTMEQSEANPDRFIPKVQHSQNTKCVDLEEDPEEIRPPPNASPSKHLSAQTKKMFKQKVANACGLDMNQRILQYMPLPPQPSLDRPIFSIGSRQTYNFDSKSQRLAKLRKINTNPERILDAPGFQDDFYLNLLSWSKKNVLAIALDNAIYLWDGDSGDVNLLVELNEKCSSLTWSDDSCHISIGKNDGNIEIWDAETMTHVRTMRSGLGVRIGSQSWLDTLCVTGSKSGEMQINDVRIKNHIVQTWDRHQGEVCGLSFREDGIQLASGANDNTVMIWDTRQNNDPIWTKRNHKAAVKAISWHPEITNLLASGGGSLDKHIHFWNTTTGNRLGSIDTGSQVSSLHWGQSYSKHSNSMNTEIVATGGTPNNCITIYNYETKFKVAEIPQAHDSRIVSSQLSPDGTTIASVGGDENLKFYRVFEERRRKRHLEDRTRGFTDKLDTKSHDDDDNTQRSPSKSTYIIR